LRAAPLHTQDKSFFWKKNLKRVEVRVTASVGSARTLPVGLARASRATPTIGHRARGPLRGPAGLRPQARTTILSRRVRGAPAAPGRSQGPGSPRAASGRGWQGQLAVNRRRARKGLVKARPSRQKSKSRHLKRSGTSYTPSRKVAVARMTDLQGGAEGDRTTRGDDVSPHLSAWFKDRGQGADDTPLNPAVKRIPRLSHFAVGDISAPAPAGPPAVGVSCCDTRWGAIDSTPRRHIQCRHRCPQTE
jgi:hypothetical protein